MTIDRIKPAIFNLLKSVTNVDPVLIDFLGYIYSASTNKIMTNDKTPKLVLKEDLRPAIKKISELFHIPSYYLKIFFKMLFSDRTIDEELIIDITRILK